MEAVIVKKLKKYLRKIIFSLVLITIFIPIVYFHLSYYFFVVVNGNSMKPTFKNNQLLVFDKRVNDIKVDDVVVFKQNNETCIKRITGSPGQFYLKSFITPVSFLRVTQSSLINHKSKYYTIEVLKQDEFYVEGDNRGESFDSNGFGPIKKSQITGKLFTF